MANYNFLLAYALTLVPDITITGAAAVGGAGTAVRITSAAHGLVTGDIAQISGLVGTVEGNGQWVVTKHDANSFDLNNSVFETAYGSGGTAKHIGHASPAVLVDNTIFTSTPVSFMLQARVEALAAGSNARLLFTDSADVNFVTEQPIACKHVAGALAKSYDSMFTAKNEDAVDARVGASGDNMRLKVFLSGGAGSTCTVSGWMK
jgi:hypothetical protein